MCTSVLFSSEIVKLRCVQNSHYNVIYAVLKIKEKMDAVLLLKWRNINTTSLLDIMSCVKV